MDVTVCVATYGDLDWRRLAKQRAIPSAEAECVPVIDHHGETLAQARNECLRRVGTEFVVFLDADDELEPGYIEALSRGTCDMRAPSVRYVRPAIDFLRDPWMPQVAGHQHACTADCLDQGNWLVIGTAVRTSILRSVGGFEEWPVYEDWAAFRKCWRAGATVEAIPEAVYQAHVSPSSRNRAPSMRFKNRVHAQIVAAA